MKLKGRAFYIRRTHRYLGVFIGVQFVLWTLGGLYFSWTDLTEIHGDHLRHAAHEADPRAAVVSPGEAIKANVPEGASVDVSRLRLVSVFTEPHYSVVYRVGEGEEESLLVNAVTGRPRPPINETEARETAAGSMRTAAGVRSIEFVSKENVGGHHEYRAKPLPAWAITFEHPENATVYIGAGDGQIHAVRTNSWRVFDLLWMLHTMDFTSRDNINNYVLRAFSILGIVTVVSGFLLFFISSKTVRRIFRPVRKRDA